MTTNTLKSKTDIVGHIGIELKKVLKSYFDVKASAFFINDAIAKNIGFKGHSDFIAIGSHESNAWLSRLLDPNCINSVMNDLFIHYYNLEERLLDSYVKIQARYLNGSQKILNTIADLDTDAVSNYKKHLIDSVDLHTHRSNPDNVNVKLAKDEFFKIFKLQFELAYTVVPVSFLFHDYVNAVLHVSKKKYSKETDAFNELMLKKEKDVIAMTPQLRTLTFSSIEDCIATFCNMFKDSLGVQVPIDLKPEYTSQDAADATNSLANYLFFDAIKHSRGDARTIFFLLNNRN